MLRTILLLLMLLLSTSSLAAQQAIPPDHAAQMAKGLHVFKQSIKPVLEQVCLKCHGGRSIEAELDLSDRPGLLKGGQSGPAIVAGKSQDSLLVKLISHQRKPFMPFKLDRLPEATIEHFKQWIDLGAPYDNPLVASKTKAKSWTEREVPAEAKSFWSFEPLKRVELPRVKNASWIRQPIDRFILAKLESSDLSPNSEASRQQLIRRAYFDLIGLPPSIEEVHAFLKDSSKGAYGRMIDRLLESPHFGERWGRHWLDLARFAESHGFEHDTDRPSAYHYRDFVIEALNRDLPFDQFVKWQIAGDEYEPNNPLALKATGFLAAGVHSTQITKSEVEKHRYDELDDKLNTIGTAMLGLSIGCARCHDHKYDPIPQRDYYRLLSSFTTTVRSEIDLNLDPKGYEKAKSEFDRAHAPYLESLKRYEAEQLPARLEEWKKSLEPAKIPWEIVDIVSAKSKGEAKLTLQPDGSLLASDKNAKFDTYTIVAKTTMVKIAAIRLEALAHPSMVKGGPGRAANGNFDLTDFKVSITPLLGRAPKTIAVKLKNPRATFEQKGLPIKASIDADAKSGWAIDPQFGQDHVAAFELEEPIRFPQGSQLTFTLTFEGNDGHNLGRPRLSIASLAEPELTAPAIPGRVRAALTQEQTPSAQESLRSWYRTIDPQWLKLKQAELEHLAKEPKPNLVKCLVSTEGLPAVRLHTQGDDFLKTTHFLRRGDSDNKEGEAKQSFLQILMPSADAEARWQSPPPAGWRTSYRRRALTEWLTDPDHGAGRLLARVIVNRLWQHHLGRGIVATPSDFGIRGERPTHPELLDYLANELIQNGWHLKPIHKLILTSATYRQASSADDTHLKIDRDNKLHWRNPSRRLEAEVIRDSILAVSGELDSKQFGPGTLDPNSHRRSIYFTVKRSKLMPMMMIFDAPEALGGMAERPTTTIAPQALHLLNSQQTRDSARSLARRLGAETSLESAIRAVYLRALSREPTSDEIQDGLAFLQQQSATYPESQRRESALTDFCQVLLCLNEFVYID